jgi:hypothetical protein
VPNELAERFWVIEEDHVDTHLEHAIGATHKDIQGALMDLENVVESINKGDYNGALINLNMGVGKRLEDALTEAGGVNDRLKALGGVYPPPSKP